MDYDDDDFLDSIKSPGELTEEVKRRSPPRPPAPDPVDSVKSPDEILREVLRRMRRGGQ